MSRHKNFIRGNVKTFVSLVVFRIPKKNARMGFRLKFVTGLRRRERKAIAPKYF
ncbi:hypothetical protein MA16_Dca019020 [Dendrobium catenatum]|uniref:Uncharacterized protein n=1 Tax=Dendrobium catenatum TaxID=906689 RepID=A0A2I0XIN5_9ASPA|nr:hypothetical protein MA16_Dca019020 [Dendrobium catenatum]